MSMSPELQQIVDKITDAEAKVLLYILPEVSLENQSLFASYPELFSFIEALERKEVRTEYNKYEDEDWVYGQDPYQAQG